MCRATYVSSRNGRAYVLLAGALLTLAVAGGCSHSRLYGLSDSDAREALLTTIPLGTGRQEAREAIKTFGPDDTEEVWTSWPPPMASSEITARFDDTYPFVNGRIALFKFNQNGSLEDLQLMTSHKIVFP